MELATVTGYEQDSQPGEDLVPLLRAAAQGEEAAWREVVNRYARRVFALAKSRCRDANVAEEITQSVFVTVAAKLGGGEYAEQGRFESWLFRVAANRIRDYVRRLRHQPQSESPETLDTRAGIEAAPASADRQLLNRLRLAMDELSDADREIVELRHHGGLSFKQMSEMLDEPIGTLLARHHRALRKLRDMLETHPASQGGMVT